MDDDDTKGVSGKTESNIDKYEEDNHDFSVKHPKLVGDSVVYMVKGVDKIGKWEGQRRYKHFHLLYDALLHRFPAVYIPKLPPKKAIVSLIYAFIIVLG